MTIIKFTKNITDMPYDIVLNIVRYMPIEITKDVILMINLFPRLTRNDLRNLQASRKDPRYVFNDLVADPDEFMKVLLVSRTILSGSRAAEYFSPGICDNYSDWDFICPRDYYYTSYFLYWLVRHGFMYDTDKSRRDAQEYKMECKVLTGYMNYKEKTHKLNILVPCFDVAPEQVLKFDLSIIQCYIAGYGAVSLNSYLTRYYMSRLWKMENDLATRFNDMHVQCSDSHTTECTRYLGFVEIDCDIRVSKYTNRRVNIISGREAEKLSNVPINKYASTTIRTIGDSNCCIVTYDYDRYYCYEWCLAAKLFLKEACHMTWHETTGSIYHISWYGAYNNLLDYWYHDQLTEDNDMITAHDITGTVAYVCGKSVLEFLIATGNISIRLMNDYYFDSSIHHFYEVNKPEGKYMMIILKPDKDEFRNMPSCINDMYTYTSMFQDDTRRLFDVVSKLSPEWIIQTADDYSMLE